MEASPTTPDLEILKTLALNADGEDRPFDDVMEALLPDLLDAAANAQVEQIKHDETVGLNLSLA